MKPTTWLVAIFLLVIAATLWPSAQPASAAGPPALQALDQPVMIGPQLAAPAPVQSAPSSLLEIGPIVEQERIGQHESLHLLGAIAATGSFDLSRHANARWILTQPFTEGRLKTIRPRLQAGLFLRF